MRLLAEYAIFSIFYAVALGASGLTKQFYLLSQYRPLLTYECYHTGVTFQPEGTVNFTVLFDGTMPNNAEGNATVWYAPEGTQDQYTQGFVAYYYDDESGTIMATADSFSEHFIQVVEPENGLAYYLKFTITSDNNREVEKLYDVDSCCGNAASLFRRIDPRGEKGFVFARDVPEPTRPCMQVSLCPPQQA